jgi:heat shock protein HtpX
MRSWNMAKTMMLLAALTALFMGIGYALGGSAGALIALVFAGGMNFYTYWNADKIVLKMHDAREVDSRTAPEFYGLVQDLVRRAGMPMPKVYLVDQPHPNAFATGRNPENAAVAATTGLLRILDTDEVEAVMAHELAHVQNRDTLIMTMAATIAGAIAMLANFAFFFRGNGRGNILVIILAMLVAPFAAMILQMALSRAREFGADRGGAALCGNPRALASALAKLDSAAKRIPSPVAQRDPAAASLYIVPGLTRSLFSTHPKTEDRVAALMAMGGEPGTRAGARSGARAPSALDPFGRR